MTEEQEKINKEYKESVVKELVGVLRESGVILPDSAVRKALFSWAGIIFAIATVIISILTPYFILKQDILAIQINTDKILVEIAEIKKENANITEKLQRDREAIARLEERIK